MALRGGHLAGGRRGRAGRARAGGMGRGRRARGGGRGGCGARAALLAAVAAVGLLVLAQLALGPRPWSQRRELVRASGAASAAGVGAALEAGEQGAEAFAEGAGVSGYPKAALPGDRAGGVGAGQEELPGQGTGGASVAGEAAGLGAASGIGGASGAGTANSGCLNGGEAEESGGCRCPVLFSGAGCETDLLHAHSEDLLRGLDLEIAAEPILGKEDLQGSVVDLAKAGDGGYFVLAQLRKFLPDRGERKRYTSCALVGNSGALLLHERGAEIDAHEAVFRFNNAPVKGYEEYVGSKTTFQVFNSKAVREYLARLKRKRPKHTWSILTITDFQGGKKEIDYNGKRMTALDQGKQVQWSQILDRLQQLGNPQNFSIVAPALSYRVKEVYEELQRRFEKEGLGKHEGLKPSSGFYTFFLMREICDSIDIYGVSSREHRREDIKGEVKYNYFNKYKGARDGRHSFPLMAHIFRLFGFAEKVVLHEG